MYPQKLEASTLNDPTPCALPSPNEPVEKDLVEAAKLGQHSAFGALSKKYVHQLLRAAHRITRSHEDAEDAVQDALMRAFIHLQDFDGRSAFATWLTRIAINSALMILRKRRTLPEVAFASLDDSNENGVGFVYQIADRAPSVETSYARNEERTLLRKAVQKLRPSLRKVVQIQQAHEASMHEIADAMSISLPAAKARLFHAKSALRKSPILKMMRRRRTDAPIRALSAA